MTTPTLSIGMPVFNSEAYLAQALDSLLGQSYEDFELIISDNASTDRTEAICRAYAKRDARVRYHRETENRGAIWNFNRVFYLARGEFFKWAAADDVCAPTFVARCIAVLGGDPSIVCCHTRTDKVSSHGESLHLPDPTDGGIEAARAGHRRLNGRSPRAHRRFHDVLLSSGWAVRCYGVIRTAALQRTRMLESYYGSEKILMAELSLIGRFFEVPETLFFQRVHTAAASHLGSLTEQQSVMAPQARHRRYPWLLYVRGYVRAVLRADLNAADRALCFLWIGRYLFQVSKWRNVWTSLMRGTGSGGSSRRLLQAVSGGRRRSGR